MDEKELFLKPNDLDLSPESAKEAIFILQDCYRFKKSEHRLYTEENLIPENIISLYLYYVEHTDYQAIIKNYKFKYIDNEAMVEPDVTVEERIGLAYIYDYISSFDFANKTPNIFIDSLKMHSMLYSACPYPEFGGKLRQDSVRLFDSSYEVIPADEARRIFQSYITKSINFNSKNVFEYIDDCIKIVVDLIKVQPFRDGNKRVFRALLNLMFGKIGIPPVYIAQEERSIYKDELLRAIETGDYSRIIKFYYYKICDAIVDLDLMKTMQHANDKKAAFVIK